MFSGLLIQGCILVRVSRRHAFFFREPWLIRDLLYHTGSCVEESSHYCYIDSNRSVSANNQRTTPPSEL